MADGLVISGASLLTLDAHDTVIEDGAIVVENGLFSYVGPAAGMMPPEAAHSTIDGTGMVVMPGFVNGHTHSYAALLKGTVDAVPLDVFMLNAIVGAGARTPEDVYLAAKISALEMMLTGTTGCLDHFSHRPSHTAEALEAVLSAYADAGVRAAVAPMFSDLPLRETIPLEPADMDDALAATLPGAPQDPDPYFAMMEAMVPKWRDHPRVNLMLGVDSPQRCSEALLARAGAFCGDHDVGNHTHLLEAKTQWAMAAGRDSRGFVAYLADRGLAGPKSSFAHFIWFEESDVARAAECGVNVVHNAASNLVLGSGIQPVLRLIDAGVNVAFGSDGLNVGHMSMFEKARLAALLPRVAEADPDRWLRAGAALRMATVNGAAVLGHKGEAGMLANGQRADFMMLDGSTVALSPRGELPAQVLFHETGTSVRHVYVDGEPILKDGAPTRFDAAQTLGQAHECAARLARDSSGALARAEAYRPGLTQMVRRVMAADHGPCRIARLL